MRAFMPAVSQQPVVLVPQHIKPATHLTSLFAGWLQSILVGYSHSSIVPCRVGDGSITFHRLALIPTLAFGRVRGFPRRS